MANRPVFVPHMAGGVGVVRRAVEFLWYAGLSTAQKQRSIAALHESACAQGISAILEISSKSELRTGIALSAFNLRVAPELMAMTCTVESAFQGSKVFERDGPFTDLYGLDSRAARVDARLRTSGALAAFEFGGERWPLMPRTAFYDWLYIHSLAANEGLANAIGMFRGFTDIEFNPKRSINCQASAAALFLSLKSHGVLEDALRRPEAFREIAYPGGVA